MFLTTNCHGGRDNFPETSMNSTNELRELVGLPAQPHERGIKYDLSRYFAKGELTQEDARLISQMASTGIAKVMDFCLVPQPQKGQAAPRRGLTRELDEYGLQIAMRRFVAIAWMIHSEMMIGESGEPLTLEQLGQLPQLDCTKVTLSLIAKQFGEKCNFHARIQKRKGSKENYAGAAKTGWAKRRAREAAAKA